MKKKLLFILFSLILVVLCKYYLSSYKIEYKIDNYSVKSSYKSNRYYFEIKDKENTIYNFDVYEKRKFSKLLINDIKVIEDDTFKCIYPIIKDIETYPLCYQNNVYIDYNLIDSNLLTKYKLTKKETKSDKDFVFYNTLSNNTYIALWNYKGYIVMNGKTYETVNIFNNDRYDNELSYQIDNKIYMPNYDIEHEFNELIVLNLTNLSKETIKLEYNIDYDSYIVGNIDNKLYLFDNKNVILYEIDTKKQKVKIIGSNEKGYVKYEKGEFVSCSKTLYTVKKIKYNNNSNSSKYSYSIKEGVYKEYNDNKNLKIKILNENVNILKEYKNEIYYIDKNTMYLYNPFTGSNKVFYNYELEFNNNNTIFIYIK